MTKPKKLGLPIFFSSISFISFLIGPIFLVLLMSSFLVSILIYLEFTAVEREHSNKNSVSAIATFKYNNDKKFTKRKFSKIMKYYNPKIELARKKPPKSS